MVESHPESVPDGNLVKLLVGQERIEGKIDRMSDRVTRNSQQLEALLDVVTGSKSGAHKGLVVRTHDLEKAQEIIGKRVANLEAGEAARDARLDAIDEKLDKVLQFQEDHPPFLYLLRFRTRGTIGWIVLILAILVVLWTTGALQELFSLFGL
jgi:hypothetical protein